SYEEETGWGGETEFLYQSARVEAAQGRLVLAPASYTHMHRGNPPLDGEKYILTSWLEFEK
ncbi:MAG: 2OG-Fe(II) oxygenase, partial [Chitinophagaceae bacterium]